VLGLDDDDEPGHERSALETGATVHEVLRELFARRPDWSIPAAANRIVDDVLHQSHARMRLLARDAVFFDLDWRRIERMVRELVAREIAHAASGADTADEVETEYEFNMELRGSESVPGTASMTWKIGGRIDRLEFYRNGGKKIQRVRVVDYKTSKNLDRYARLLAPANFATYDLQIPVYALAIRAGLGARLAVDTTIEGSYIALASREKETAIPIAPELLETDAARRAALTAHGYRTIADRIAELIGSAAAGRFDVDPLACDEYCSYRAVCRYRKAFSR
jgi:ATP-dependent helicase/DNAse subunit B